MEAVDEEDECVQCDEDLDVGVSWGTAGLCANLTATFWRVGERFLRARDGQK